MKYMLHIMTVTTIVLSVVVNLWYGRIQRMEGCRQWIMNAMVRTYGPPPAGIVESLNEKIRIACDGVIK